MRSASCGLLRRDVLEDVDIGFAFLPEYRRRGYARVAAEATIVSPENTASIRLLEGLGFRSGWPGEHPDGEHVHLYARELSPE